MFLTRTQVIYLGAKLENMALRQQTPTKAIELNQLQEEARTRSLYPSSEFRRIRQEASPLGHIL
jgi:hypothetical protein